LDHNGLVLFILALALAMLFSWGFRTLPREGWQVMACIPRGRRGDGLWNGVNFTYYGFFNATANVLAVLLLIVLLMSVPVAPAFIFMLAACGLGICIPASKLLARWVEGKPHTFTVGGASFAGVLVLPWVVLLLDMYFWRFLGGHLPVMTAMAAIAVAYSLGEGIGRLACISFGCCYGKPLSAVHPLLRKLFAKHYFVFDGPTKKIAYAHHLDGEPVVPVQALTSVLYTAAALLGSYLFLAGLHAAAFVSTVAVTQLWRLLSEFLRADYRGDRVFSAYQIMALAAVGYAVLLMSIFPEPAVRRADIVAGLASIWNPAVIVFLQVLWAAIYIYTGKSRVTASVVSLCVVRDKT
jgi:prolipoprotein diacylglyceryltransferase